METWFEKYDIELKEVHALEHIHRTVEYAEKCMRKGKKDDAYKKLAEAKGMIEDLFAVKGITGI